MKQLILGGARSGKSRLAESRAADSNKEVIYIATAQAFDAEMESRIQLHRDARPDHWIVVEEPRELPKVLAQYAASSRCILVDCLTLWVSNLLLAGYDEQDDAFDTQLLETEIQALYRCLDELPGDVIFVSNEVGWGIVPMGALSRIFQDQTGWLHQRLGALCDGVTLVVAGIPMEIKTPAVNA